jgi:hypothetical protein
MRSNKHYMFHIAIKKSNLAQLTEMYKQYIPNLLQKNGLT